MSHLAPCPACNRHVDVAESACPFCATALPAAFRAQQPPAPPRARLGRAALMAAGATLMGAAACSSNDAISSADAATDRPAVTKDASEDRSAIAIYGAPLPGHRRGRAARAGRTGTGGSDWHRRHDGARRRAKTVRSWRSTEPPSPTVPANPQGN